MKADTRTSLLTATTAGLVLLAGWFAYQPALSGTFLLDDLANLGGLANVDDRASALRFLLSGTAGPLGRPIALASFLPQAEQWAADAAPFLAVNVAIHLLNACLLGSFLFLLSRARGIESSNARFVALSAMALWLFMPLLASASLMIVQRMTTLSATFVLLGLNAYLFARGRAERNPARALWGMSAAIAFGSGLAVLTKESGALLPVFVLVLEATLLSPPAALAPRSFRTWQAVFLLLPTLLILGYLATRLPYPETIELRRGFTGLERLVTEARILWEYLLDAFVPRVGRYGPFHDAYPVTGLRDPFALAAALGWLAVVVMALAWRRKRPLAAFAALWFVGGHLLESTTIALELYFEHRNYLPIAGPVYALCSLAATVPENYRRIARVSLSAYVAVCAFVLFSLASLWGDPQTASRFWYQQNPASPRAATWMATMQLELEGPGATLGTLRAFVEEHPEHAYLGLPALNLTCVVAPQTGLAGYARGLEPDLRRADFSYTAANFFSDLLDTVTRSECKGMDTDTVERLARALFDNPRYRASPAYTRLHNQILARIDMQAGDVDAALARLDEAAGIRPGTDLDLMIVTTLVSDGRLDAARRYIAEARERAPLNPLRNYLWHLSLDELDTYVAEVAESSTRKPDGDRSPEAGET